MSYSLEITNKSFEFMATMGGILKFFNKNENVIIESYKLNDYGENLEIEVYFNNSKTARQDFFGFFESIGYTMTEVQGCTNEDYYDTEDYPDGAIVIPEYVKMWFNAEVEEVVYQIEQWDLQSK